MARKVPGGFAGVRYDRRAKQWFLQLVDTSQASAAKAFLRRSIALGEGELTVILSSEDIESSRVEAALWTVGQLHDWLRYVTPLALGDAISAGAVVHSVGVSAPLNRLIVSVGDYRSRAVVDSVLATRHLPCHLIAIEIGMPPKPD